MGRKKKLKITREKLILLYKQKGNLKAAAKALNVCPRTISRYLKQFNYKLKTGPKANHFFPHYSCMIKFVRRFPNIKFPRSVKKISELTGCTKDAVTTYLYRRRKQVKNEVSKLPDFRHTTIKLKDTKGRIIPSSNWKAYSIYVNKWTVKLRIEAILKNNTKVKFFTTLKEVSKDEC